MHAEYIEQLKHITLLTADYLRSSSMPADFDSHAGNIAATQKRFAATNLVQSKNEIKKINFTGLIIHMF